ncbi:MAG: hypothetical protein H7Y16_08790 [Candidatus Parcubacteria bacterium]|nr:hypothetical protein [Burkholderiales bacterium]
MIDWGSVFLTLGSTSIVTAGIVWILKALADRYFKRDLETHKVALQRDADLQRAEIDRRAKEQLQQQQHQLSLLQQDAQTRNRTQAEQAERTRQEIERWANPILGAVRELRARLENILENAGYPALSRSGAGGIHPDWSIDFDYFMSSTVFLFCQYFCWERLLQERLTFDLFGEGASKDRFLAQLRNVRQPLSMWPLETSSDLAGGDAQVFGLQQRAFGEALIEQSGAEVRCMRAADFFDRWNDPAFRARFAPLEKLLEEVTPASVRGERLKRTRDALVALEEECVTVLSPRPASPGSPAAGN